MELKTRFTYYLIVNYQTISEIYDANDRVRARLKTTVSDLSDAELNFMPEGGWTIANIVEHLSMVENGMGRICAKLLGEAQTQGGKSSGEANISPEFLQKLAGGGDAKMEAPERVRPTGTLNLAESFAKMEENRQKLEELRPLFESVECSAFKFPHPYFGDMSAHEWLALLGGHEAKHIAQIEGILSQYHLQ